MRTAASFIRAQTRAHHAWFDVSLPLIASENLMSPLARELVISDLGDRYAEGLPGKRYYQGLIYIDRIEEKVMELARNLFDCAHADMRPISGTVANMAVLKALTHTAVSARRTE